MSESLKIRPYARLLTMLGNQLIKDERIALIELIKNSYDADANWVKVTFENFGEKYEVLSNSKIIIQDNGDGMTKDVLSISCATRRTRYACDFEQAQIRTVFSCFV